MGLRLNSIIIKQYNLFSIRQKIIKVQHIIILKTIIRSCISSILLPNIFEYSSKYHRVIIFCNTIKKSTLIISSYWNYKKIIKSIPKRHYTKKFITKARKCNYNILFTQLLNKLLYSNIVCYKSLFRNLHYENIMVIWYYKIIQNIPIVRINWIVFFCLRIIMTYGQN